MPANALAKETISLGEFKGLAFHREGGMGKVYRGHHPQLDIPIAVKRIRPELAARPDIMQRFRQEAQTAAKINHPNIVRLFEFRATNDDAYFVMEFLHQSLRDVLDAAPNRNLDIPTAIRYIRDVTLALCEMHRMGFCHRDVKPDNIMIAANGSAKLGDLGICKSRSSSLTRHGSNIGCREYMAPEQCENAESVDIVADIYSLGIVFFEMVTGERSYATRQSNPESGRLDTEPPKRLRAHEVYPAVPVAISDVIDRMTAWNSSDRIQTPDAVLAALDAACIRLGDGDADPCVANVDPDQSTDRPTGQDNAVDSTTSIRAGHGGGRSPRHGSIVWIVAAVCTGMIIAAGVLFFARKPTTEPSAAPTAQVSSMPARTVVVDPPVVASETDLINLIRELDAYVGDRANDRDYWTSSPRIYSWLPLVAGDTSHAGNRVAEIWTSALFAKLQKRTGCPVVNRNEFATILREHTVNLNVLADPVAQFAPKILPATVLIAPQLALSGSRDLLHVELTDVQTGEYIDIIHFVLADANAIDSLPDRIVSGVTTVMSANQSIQGRVSTITGQDASLNIGQCHGVSEGMEFRVFHDSPPYTATSLSRRQPIGAIQIISTGRFDAVGTLTTSASAADIKPGMPALYLAAD